ncbi:hypothetical protein [Brevundimonas sp.]|uniref:hypothetical protein n=1 Tax=Brevundimonas sp. TaxID=1871086 RepID=UPI0028B2331D|nr:hypothetical protein [Brevundimonas sp.]
MRSNPTLSRATQKLVFLSALAAASAWSATSAIAQKAECYDAEVSARIVSQTPTIMPDCNDCIIMRWPWIVDLDVRRAQSGEVRRGRLTVLTVQHTDRRSDRAVRWKLRRNTLGGFNVVWFGEAPKRRCSPDAPPALAYITPPNGQTLEDLRREGREYYDRDN